MKEKIVYKVQRKVGSKEWCSSAKNIGSEYDAIAIFRCLQHDYPGMDFRIVKETYIKEVIRTSLKL